MLSSNSPCECRRLSAVDLGDRPKVTMNTNIAFSRMTASLGSEYFSLSNTTPEALGYSLTCNIVYSEMGAICVLCDIPLKA